MPNRMTATEKWDNPWFCGLSKDNKLFWTYVLDKCNHAGIWRPNWVLVGFHIPGYAHDHSAFENRILEISEDKWFIPKFIFRQYGKLNRNNSAHKGALKMLETEGLYEFIKEWEVFRTEDASKGPLRELGGGVKGVLRGYIPHKDKDTDKVMDKGKGQGKDKDTDPQGRKSSTVSRR